MIIHKEGYKSIAIGGVIYVLLSFMIFTFLSASIPWLAWLLFAAVTFLFLFLISFFRVPLRVMTMDPNLVIAPADGKVVVIEEAEELEYFKGKRLQVSIFMSPANVHVNRSPVTGEVVYSKHHQGKFLVAWDPQIING
jgi:phosphatidylserine decarboxylase